MRILSCVFFIVALLPITAFSENLSKCYTGWDTTESGHHLKAIALFNECIKEGELSEASLARTYRNIGIAYQRAKKPKMAIKAYTKAIAINPTDVVNDYMNRGNAYDEANMFKEAMADYDKALEVHPGYAQVFYNRGITYEHQHMMDNAKTEFIAAYKHGLRTRLLYERLVLHGLIKPKQ